MLLDDFRTFRDAPVAEGVSALLTAQLVDEDGLGIPGSQLIALTFTLLDRDSGAIVHSRNLVNVLNANGGTVDEDGNLRLQLTALDTVLLDVAHQREGRIARFRWTWGSNVEGLHEHWFDVTRVQP